MEFWGCDSNETFKFMNTCIIKKKQKKMLKVTTEVYDNKTHDFLAQFEVLIEEKYKEGVIVGLFKKKLVETIANVAANPWLIFDETSKLNASDFEVYKFDCPDHFNDDEIIDPRKLVTVICSNEEEISKGMNHGFFNGEIAIPLLELRPPQIGTRKISFPIPFRSYQDVGTECTIRGFSAINQNLVSITPVQDKTFNLDPLDRVGCMLGFRTQMPTGTYFQLVPKTSTATFHGITLLSAPQIIDSSYTGEWMVIAVNMSRFEYTLRVGDKICQAIFCRTDEYHFVRALNFPYNKPEP